MCGDSTKIEDVEKLMDGKKADMVYTDPPYDIDLQGGFGSGAIRRNYKSLEGKKVPDLMDWMRWIPNVTTDKSVVAVWENWKNMKRVWDAIESIDYKVKNCVIWYCANRHHAFRQAWFYNKYDPCVIGMKKGHYFNVELAKRVGTRDVIENPLETEKGSGQNKVFGAKPIKLNSKIIPFFTPKNGIVLDFFGGSGSTLMTCEQLGITSYSMEIYPEYCDVIRKRYANFIGKGEEWQKETPKI
jgi:DNA modification methylase